MDTILRVDVNVDVDAVWMDLNLENIPSEIWWTKFR